MLESKIEREVSKYAKSKGYLTYKFTGHKGVPDRMYIKDGVVIFIEFKQEGKLPTKLQEKTISDIQSQSIPVYVIDNIDDGKEVINKWVD